MQNNLLIHPKNQWKCNWFRIANFIFL